MITLEKFALCVVCATKICAAHTTENFISNRVCHKISLERNSLPNKNFRRLHLHITQLSDRCPVEPQLKLAINSNHLLNLMIDQNY